MSPRTVVSASLPSPVWAKTLFKIMMIVSVSASSAMLADPDISDKFKARFSVYSQAATLAMGGIAKLIGVKEDEPEK